MIINPYSSALDCYPPLAVSQGSKLLSKARTYERKVQHVCTARGRHAACFIWQRRQHHGPFCEAAGLRPVCACLQSSCEAQGNARRL